MRGRGSPTGFIELPTNYSHFARIPTIPLFSLLKKPPPALPILDRFGQIFPPRFPPLRTDHPAPHPPTSSAAPPAPIRPATFPGFVHTFANPSQPAPLSCQISPFFFAIFWFCATPKKCRFLPLPSGRKPAPLQQENRIFTTELQHFYDTPTANTTQNQCNNSERSMQKHCKSGPFRSRNSQTFPLLIINTPTQSHFLPPFPRRKSLSQAFYPAPFRLQPPRSICPLRHHSRPPRSPWTSPQNKQKPGSTKNRTFPR